MTSKMKVLCILLSMVEAIQADYHTDVGIALAARIKAYEDKIFAESSEMQSRVVGGEVAPALAHPYMVGLILRLKSEFLSVCGSTLVTDTRLVTAAHCLTSTESLKAVLGSQYLFHGGTRIITKDFVAHSNFNEGNSMNYDIGVVKLPNPVEISDKLHPIKLPTPEEAEVVGEEAVAVGWGLTKDEDRGKQSDEYLTLNQVRLQIAPELECAERYKSYGNVTFIPLGHFVCTSGEGGVGTCDGDAGGPLIVERNGTKTLIAVASRNHKPCEGYLPSVFTRVLLYKKFILEA